jgi:hypothetical protein
MSSHRRARLASRIAGAALLGAATILVPKADPNEHWATPVEVVVTVEAEPAGDPDDPLFALDVLLDLAVL